MSFPLFVLYGSATGNAQHIAKDLAATYTTKYLNNGSADTNATTAAAVFDSVICCELDQFKKKCLPLWETEPPPPPPPSLQSNDNKNDGTKKYGVLIIASTTGNGEPPENCSRFVRYIKHKNTKNTCMGNINYAILGLGDTNYDKFCETGKVIDKKLSELGGTRIRSVACADEGTGLEDVVDPWVSTILQEISAACCTSTNSNSNENNTTASTDNTATTITEKIIETNHCKEEEPVKNVEHGNEENCNTLISLDTLGVVDTNDSCTNNNNNKDLCTLIESSTSIGVMLVRSVLQQQMQKQKQKQNEKCTVQDYYENIIIDPTTIPKTIPQSSKCILFHDHNNNENNETTIINNNSSSNNKTMTSRSNSGVSTAPSSISDSEDNIDIIDNSSNDNPDNHSYDTTTRTTKKSNYYNYKNPYNATIMNGRYLTKQTRIHSAQQIVQDIIAKKNCSSSSSSSSTANITSTNIFSNVDHWNAATTILETTFPLVESTSRLDDGTTCIDNDFKSTPCNATTSITSNNNTTPKTTTPCDINSKRVIELTISLPTNDHSNNSKSNRTNDTGTTFHYEPGDSIGIFVENPPPLVEYILDLLEHKKDQKQQQQQQSTTKTVPIKRDQIISIVDSNDDDVNNNYHNNSSDADNNVSTNAIKTTSKSMMTVEEFVRTQIDIASYLKSCHPRNKSIMISLAEIATDPAEKWALELLSSKTDIGKYLYHTIIDEQRWNLIDVLHSFQSTHTLITLDYLINLLQGGIPPRYYSVTSSPLVTNEKFVSIAFSVVDYITPSLTIRCTDTDISGSTENNNSSGNNNNKKDQEYGCRRIHGTATHYMEIVSSHLLWLSSSSNNKNGIHDGNCVSSGGKYYPKIKIFPKPSPDFHLPKSLSTPIIMIGPGTGVAPFIGFIQHRHCLQQQTTETTNVDVGTSELYFGCRNMNHDWLYENEMKNLQCIGALTNVYTAFSRDDDTNDPSIATTTKAETDAGTDDNSSTNKPTHCRYVQHIMKHSCTTHTKRFVDLLVHQSAVVYICGDGNKMARDVQDTILELLACHHFSTSDGSTTGSGTSSSDNDPSVLAQQYLDRMKEEKRFLLDIWS